MSAREGFDKANIHGLHKLFEAAEKNQPNIVVELLAKGADVNTRTTVRGKVSALMKEVPYAVGSTALHAACLTGAHDVVRILIDAEADVNLRNQSGQTPLDCALLSHAYFVNEVEKKKKSRFSFQRTADRAQAKADVYEKIINDMLVSGAKPALYLLPEKFAQAGTVKTTRAKNNTPDA